MRLTVDDIFEGGARPMAQVVHYGSSLNNYMEVFDDDQSSDRYLVTIHGGFWRTEVGLHETSGLAAYFAKCGWRVANIEYRRASDGGTYPTILEDVRDAIYAAAEHWSVPRGSVPVLGHSAGGHLALLAIAEGFAPFGVALAPITDLQLALDQAIGDHAAARMLGDGAQDPATIAAASPVASVNRGGRRLVVHGSRDSVISIDHFDRYREQVRSVGANVDLLEIAGADHFDVTELPSASVEMVRSWLDRAWRAEPRHGGR
ncbi:alpha/beta hydrolase family protein [Mycobacteroides abscessus]